MWDTPTPRIGTCFRTIVLHLLPSAALFILSPIELMTKSSDLTIPWRPVNCMRMTVAAVSMVNTFVSFYFHWTHEWMDISTQVIALCDLLSLTWLLILMLRVKRKGFTRSSVIWIFVLVSSITSALDLYAILSDGDATSGDVVTGAISLVSFCILFLLSSVADAFDVIDREEGKQKVAPQDVVSYPSYLLYWFATPLAIRGWKGTLGEVDVFPISSVDKTETVSADFRKHLGMKSGDRGTKLNDVCIPLIKTFKFSLLQLAVAKASLDATDLLKALFLKWLMNYVHDSREIDWHGPAILSLFMVVSSINSLSWNAARKLSFRIAARMRSALRSSIYRKSLTMSMSARRERSVGQLVNLMAVDSDKLRPVIDNMNSFWTSPLQIGLAFFLLYQEMGVSALYGLAAVILLLPLNTILLFKMKASQKEQMRKKDERVKTMSEILNGIKLIKLYAWEEAFMRVVSDIRNPEIKHIREIVTGNACIQYIQKAAPTIVALVTFAVYVFSGHVEELTPARVFFCLAVFNIIKIPLTNYPNLMKEFTTFLVCRKRLNSFFQSSDIQPYVDRSSPHSESPIQLHDAELCWDEDAAISDVFTLKIDNLKVDDKSLTAVVGPVGSGKSSLLSAILGEMHLTNGSVSISSEIRKIAYVPQQAWILNQTVKENILFGHEFNEQKYRQVVRLCELEPDLLVLPAGDETEIGERGINLSGGQKQRISIARACYADADLYLFDDPLSAVDAHVAKSLFDNILSSSTGLLKQKTRILVTNNLSVLPAVDHVLVLQNGRVKESGSYASLMRLESSFLAMAQAHVSKEFSALSQGNRHGKRKTPNEMSTIRAQQKQTDKLIEIEKRTSRMVKLGVYASYFKHISGLMCVVVATMILSQVFEVGSNVWLSDWSADTTSFNTTSTAAGKNGKDNGIKLFVYLNLGILSTLTLLAGCVTLARASVIASASLHEKLLYRVMRSPMTFFETTPIGRIVNRFSKDMDGIDITLPDAMFYVALNGLLLLGTVFLIIISVPVLILVLIPISVGLYYVQWMYINSVRQVRGEDSRCCSFLFSFFSESLTGASAIRAYNITEQSIRHAEELIDRNQVCTLAVVDLNRWRNNIMQLAGLILILAIGIAAIIFKGSDSSMLIGLALTYSIQISFCMNHMFRHMGQVESEMVSVERVLEYSSIESEAEWRSAKREQGEDWPSEGGIQFEEYSVRYRPGLELVLKEVTMWIRGEEKVGVVGRTGAGKSSIAAALFRLMEPASGRILIDGVNIAGIGLHELRSKLTIIPQDPVLFSGSVRRNMDPLDSKTEDEVWEALRLAHLSSFVSTLPGALSHRLAEGGDDLSVGQRQLMCLGRALLRDTRILILDEATASVDPHTDSLIQETMRQQFAHCTVLTIAHRLHTILDSDRVLVLHDGRVAEFDDPCRLLRDPLSLFYSLARDAGIV